MAKGKTNIIGITPHWRKGIECDALRIGISKGEYFWVSAKIHPTLKQINAYLKAEKLTKESALQNNHFQALYNRLCQELKSEHGLKEYRAREQYDLKRKSFNFGDSVEEFFNSKSETSVPHQHRSKLLHFWLPFFLSKGCQHPKDFRQWRNQALSHLKSAKKVKVDEKYSIQSLPSMASAFNEYMRFLRDFEYISDSDFFLLNAKVHLEKQKRTGTSQSRNKGIYTFDDIYKLKSKIDVSFKDDLTWKVRAYFCLLGICTGLRRGNLMGLTPECLQPDAKVPHIITKDNIVNGWSRGTVGKEIFEVSTKTFVGQAKLPLLQPEPSFAIEVARFIKDNSDSNEYIMDCFPDTVGKWWKKICIKIGAKYVNPHGWRHSYATNGAMNLHKLYKGNGYFLQMCCLHEKYETTAKYINQLGDHFLSQFESGET